MGTEVIKSCISELIRFRREDIILKVATFGGIAVQA
jgi:hypothetical protein